MKTNENKKLLKKFLVLNLFILAVICASFYTLKPKEILTIKSLAINVRSGPGLSNDIIKQIKKGDTIEIIEEQDKWYKVKLDDRSEGWVASWLVANSSSSAITSVKAKVNTDKTKLREQPDTSGTIISELKKDAEVIVTNEANGWSNVELDGQSGWIFSDLLTIEKNDESNEVTISKLYARQNETKIRETPAIDSNVVSTIDLGDTIKLLSSEGDWYKVELKDGATGYVANWVVSSAKPNKNTNVTSIAEATIMLDAGHGGSDAGSISNNGEIYEKVITLATVNYVKKELQKYGANVLLTRDDDSLVDLPEIANKSNRANADIFISFHYDSTEGSNIASGTTTYFYHDKHKLLANTINDHLEHELPLPNRGVEFGDFQVLRDNNQPAVLLELGYMNSDYDLSEFQTKTYQKKVAAAVTKALVEYFQ